MPSEPPPSPPGLAVVIPVYNEAVNLPALLRDWQPVFQAVDAGYTINFIDDGSTDDSLAILSARQRTDPHLLVHQQQNAGHGPAILKGYGMTGEAAWVFQIDSDHQLDTVAFQTLWTNRDDYDLLLGERQQKNASPARQGLSRITGWMVKALYGNGVKDINSPYRLIRGSDLKQALAKIPAGSFAPNVLLTAWFIRRKKRIFTGVVWQRGENPRRGRMTAYFLRGALRSGVQTVLFRLRQ
jgi:dolichol-phosphate mannosyltransferase